MIQADATLTVLTASRAPGLGTTARVRAHAAGRSSLWLLAGDEAEHALAAAAAGTRTPVLIARGRAVDGVPAGDRLIPAFNQAPRPA